MSRAPRIVLFLCLVAAGAGAGWWWWQGRQESAQQPASVEAANGAPAGQPGAQGGVAGGRRGPGGAPRVPVTVAEAVRRDVALTVDALGTVVPLSSVVVRTQLDGQLTEILFQEGQEVKAGDVLARVDDRAATAALAQAEGKLAYDQAQLANARLDLQRYIGLARNSGVTQQQVDTQRAQVAMLEAQVKQDQAAIDLARTQLGYATIRSPINGRVGIRAVDVGNIVRTSDTNGIVTVTQMSPISVTFTLPQQELPRLMRAMASGPVPVQTLPGPGGNQPVMQGRLVSVDNAVDAATGTIKARAVFENENRALWPGAFVNIRLQIEVVPDATVVPLVAVQRGPEGPYVFVVKGDQTVELRPVTIGAMTQADATVRQGLRPGERVVTSGALRLNPGTAVAIANDDGSAPAPGLPNARQRRTAEAVP